MRHIKNVDFKEGDIRTDNLLYSRPTVIKKIKEKLQVRGVLLQ